MKHKDILNKNFSTNIGNIHIKEFLGKGKSGYSYLGENNYKQYVVKIMHDEPCPYYNFNDINKIILEREAFFKLHTSNIRVPELLTHNPVKNYLVKDYVEGHTATELIANNEIDNKIIQQLFQMSDQAEKAGINIDFFPSNFIISHNELFYIDYEINPYTPEWNLLNWGIYYWANSEGFKKYLSTGDVKHINESPEKGIPVRKNVNRITKWQKMYG